MDGGSAITVKQAFGMIIVIKPHSLKHLEIRTVD